MTGNMAAPRIFVTPPCWLIGERITFNAGNPMNPTHERARDDTEPFKFFDKTIHFHFNKEMRPFTQTCPYDSVGVWLLQFVVDDYDNVRLPGTSIGTRSRNFIGDGSPRSGDPHIQHPASSSAPAMGSRSARCGI
jgi:hypothetical protein